MFNEILNWKFEMSETNPTKKIVFYNIRIERMLMIGEMTRISGKDWDKWEERQE
jgi:hypothetical protein